jgi:hypothetical protein
MKSPYWRFECKDSYGSWVELQQKPTMETLWPHIKDEGWNGKMKNYRLSNATESSIDLESNLYCGIPCEWRVCQTIRLTTQ